MYPVQEAICPSVFGLFENTNLYSCTSRKCLPLFMQKMGPNRPCTITLISANNTPSQNACYLTRLEMAVASVGESWPQLIRSRIKPLPPCIKMIRTVRGGPSAEVRPSRLKGDRGRRLGMAQRYQRIVLESSGIVKGTPGVHRCEN